MEKWKETCTSLWYTLLNDRLVQKENKSQNQTQFPVMFCKYPINSFLFPRERKKLYVWKQLKEIFGHISGLNVWKFVICQIVKIKTKKVHQVSGIFLFVCTALMCTIYTRNGSAFNPEKKENHWTGLQWLAILKCCSLI